MIADSAAQISLSAARKSSARDTDRKWDLGTVPCRSLQRRAEVSFQTVIHRTIETPVVPSFAN